jgi:hypothetical protein
MNVTARSESFDERRIPREVGQQSQFDLRVVRRKELPARAWDKPASDVAPQLPPD